MTPPHKSVPKKPKACKHCGKEFFPPPSTIARKFCCLRCANSSRVKLMPQICEQCGSEFTPYNSRKRRFCSSNCQHKSMVGSEHPLWRGNRRQERGSTWKENSKIARDRDKVCVGIGCGLSPVEIGQRLSVDHIVPFRLTVIYGQTDGIDPNDLRNLAALCRSCHAKKTQAESLLLRGDMIGFLSIIRTIMPMDRIETALALWGLGRKKENLIPFGSTPIFLESTGRGPKKKGPDIRLCSVCGNTFERVRGQFSKKQTCSTRCAYILRDATRYKWPIVGMHEKGLKPQCL